MTDYANLKKFEKSQINGLTKHLSNLRWTTEQNLRRDNEVIFKRAEELGMEIDYNDSHMRGEKLTFKTPRKITREQTKFGKAWLKEYFFKKDGTPRSGKRTQYIGDRVLAIAKKVHHFEFIGVLGLANNYDWTLIQFLPMYRAYDAKGNYFDYAPVHWGEPVIMEG